MCRYSLKDCLTQVHLQSLQLFYTYVCNSASIDITDCLMKHPRQNLKIVTDFVQRSFVNQNIYLEDPHRV